MAEEETQVMETPEATSPVEEQTTEVEAETGENLIQTPAENIEGERTPTMVPLSEVQKERARRRELEDTLKNPEALQEHLEKLRGPQAPPEPQMTVDEMNKFITPEGNFDIPAYNAYRDKVEAVRANQSRAEWQAALDMRDAEAANPELKTDDEFAQATVAWAQAYRIPYTEAAAKIKSLMSRKAQEAKKEGMKESQSNLTERERAQTAGVGNTPSGDETSQLKEEMKSSDPEVANKARIEYLKKINKKIYGF